MSETCEIKRKTKIYHAGGTAAKSNIKIEEWGKIDTPITQIHDRSLYWLGLCTSITIVSCCCCCCLFSLFSFSFNTRRHPLF